MVLGTSLYKSYLGRSNSVTNSINEDTSLFVTSLDILRESNNNINQILKNINTKVILAENSIKNQVYLQEFSFIDMISTIINFFIEGIKKLFDKFKSLFYKITNDDKYIEKYSKELKNMKGEFQLTFPRFNYTCFDADIPSINLKKEFFDDYSVLIEKLKEISDLKTKTERCEKMRSLEADIFSTITPAYYDSLRQRTLNLNYMISSDKYAEELFNRFRDNGTQVSSKVNVTEITNVLNRYLNNKKLYKEVEKAKNETISAAKDIEKKIKSITLSGNNNHYIPYDTEEETLFNKILQRKIGQINEACNIFVMGFSAKLDAVKESAIQDKKVLLEAIKFINRGGTSND